MSEIISTYLLDEPDVVVPMARNEFYKEQVGVFKKTGKPTRAVEIIHVFVFNESGELFVQKRSHDKAHNPGLLDKSIGGHVQEGDPIDYTVMVETVQELQVPSIVLRSEHDFKKTMGLLHSYLNTIAIMKHFHVDTKFHLLDRVMNGEVVTIANKVHLFFGVYGGRIKTVDKEATGVLLYTLDNLAKELETFPDMFTNDLKYYFEHYQKDMKEFVKNISSYERG